MAQRLQEAHGDGSERATRLPALSVRLTPDFERDAICLLGLPFDRLTLPAAQAKVTAAITNQRRCHVATPNLNLLRIAHGDRSFRRTLAAADMSVADGMPLVWMARILGLGISERAAGSDLFEALGRNRNDPVRTFFFGGTEQVCSDLRFRLGERPSGVRCVGALAPGFGTAEEMSKPETLECINAAEPELVVVAVSARKGLEWISRNEQALAAPVIANLGATINFAAGKVPRAPEAWRRRGFEWLWRIRQEPALWRRYAADFVFLTRAILVNVAPALALRMLERRSHATQPRVSIEAQGGSTGRRLKLSGDFTEETLGVLREALSVVTRQPGPLMIDLDGVQRIDAAALGLLLLAEGHQARVGEPLTLVAQSRRLRLKLRIHGCGFLLDEREAYLPWRRPRRQQEGMRLAATRGMTS